MVWWGHRDVRDFLPLFLSLKFQSWTCIQDTKFPKNMLQHKAVLILFYGLYSRYSLLIKWKPFDPV